MFGPKKGPPLDLQKKGRAKRPLMGGMERERGGKGGFMPSLVVY